MATETAPLPLQAAADVYHAWQKANPQDSSSTREFARRYHAQTGSNRFSELENASALSRGVMWADNLARPFSEKLSSSIRGGAEPQSFGLSDALTQPGAVAKEGLAKGVDLIGSSVPSAAMSMWALAGGNKRRALKTVMGLLPYGLISGYNESRDVPHAITNALSLGASPLLAQGAVSLATKKGAGGAGKALAGVLGGMVGDVAEIGSAPTADPQDSYLDRYAENIPTFFKDPSNILSLGVAESPFAATDLITSRSTAAQAARDERVLNTPGLHTTGGKAVNLRRLLQTEHNLDIPNGVTDSTLRMAAESVRVGNTEEAQRKVYASISDSLSEQQLSRFEELTKAPEKRLAEYTRTVKRDWQSEEQHLDEFEFEFNDPIEANNFIRGEAGSDIPMKSRQVGNKVFYWGTEDTSMARFSEQARAGKVNNSSFLRKHPSRTHAPSPEVAGKIMGTMVADPRGNPIRVFRGELQGQEGALQSRNQGSLKGLQGAWYSPHPEIANTYTAGELPDSYKDIEFSPVWDKGASVTPYFLDIKKPAKDADVRRIALKQYEEAIARGSDIWDMRDAEVFELLENNTALVDELKAEGFDGVHMTDYSASGDGKKAKSWYVFDAEKQAYSAVGSQINKGSVQRDYTAYQESRSAQQEQIVSTISRVRETFTSVGEASPPTRGDQIESRNKDGDVVKSGALSKYLVVHRKKKIYTTVFARNQMEAHAKSRFRKLKYDEVAMLNESATLESPDAPANTTRYTVTVDSDNGKKSFSAYGRNQKEARADFAMRVEQDPELYKGFSPKRITKVKEFRYWTGAKGRSPNMAGPNMGSLSPESGNLFGNPAIDIIERALNPRLVAGGKKAVGPALTVSKMNRYKGKAVAKILKKQLPDDIYQMYIEAGLEDLNPSKNQLMAFLRGAIPTLSVRPLKVGEALKGKDSMFVSMHALETEGFEIDSNPMDDSPVAAFNGVRYSDNDDISIFTEEVQGHLRNLFDNFDINHYEDAAHGLAPTDAATGRFGVEPVPVKDMDRPVDILIRQEGDEKYTGPHFGGSDKNVVVSVRGYFTDKDTFFPFEVQSDWGQDESKRVGYREEDYKDAIGKTLSSQSSSGSIISNRLRAAGYKMTDVVTEKNHKQIAKASAGSDSPFLARYERLALQETIAHARREGATKIILPDAETAMMIEHHDRLSDKMYKEGKHYDNNISDKYFTLDTKEGTRKDNPNLGQNVKLTGHTKVDKDTKSADGIMLEYVASPGNRKWISLEKFKFSDYQTIRRSYDRLPDITYMAKPSTESGMRTHYGQTGTLRGTLEKLGARFLGPADLGKMTNRDASAYFDGKDSITGYEFDISGINPDQFNLFSLQQNAQEANLISYETQVKLTRLQNEMKKNGKIMSPADFVQMMKERMEGGKNGSDFDVDIILRAMFRIAGPDKLVSVFRDSRTVEGLHTRGFSDPSNTVGLNMADQNVGQALQTLGHELTHTSINDFKNRDPEGYQQLEDAVFSLDSEQFITLFNEANALFDLGIDSNYASGANFDPNNSNFKETVVAERMAGIAEIIVGRGLTKPSQVNKFVSALPLEVQRFLRLLTDKIHAWVVKDSRYGKQFSSETKKLFNDMQKRMDKQVFHSERAADMLAKMFQGSLAFDPTTLGSTQISELSKSGLTKSSVSKEFIKDLTFMEREGMTRMQKNLWSTLALTKRFPVARPLFERLHTYRSEIQKTLMTYFGELGQNAEQSLNHEDAMNAFEKWVHDVALSDPRLEKISKVFEADQKLRQGKTDISETASANQTSPEEMKRFFHMNDEDIMMVERIRGLVTRVAYQEFLDMSHRDYLNQASFLASQFGDVLTKPVAEDIGRSLTQLATEVGKLEAEAGNTTDEIVRMQKQRLAAVHKNDMARRLEQELSQAGVALEAGDPRVAKAIQLALLQSSYRIKHMQTIRREGYAPQTRRGNFMLRAKDQDGEPWANGFKTKRDAELWWKENAEKEGLKEGVITEKDKLGEHYRHYTSGTLQGIRRQFSGEMDKIIAEQSKDPNMSDQTKAVLKEIQSTFGDMDAELSDALGQKADPFKMRRNDVKGFQKEDFLPNIFDYINIKTIIGQKGIISARAKLEMSQPDFYKNKELLQQFREITDYTLNSKHSEWSPVRKFVYMYFLGLSPRHLFQNITQPFLIGVPELAAITKSFTKAPQRMARAYVQVSAWNRKGTTGNKNLDRVLKQAEDEQVWNPSMLQHYLPTQDLALGPSTMTKYIRGKSGFMKRARIQAAKADRMVQKVMRVTAESSEILNRQVAFVARANEVTDATNAADLETLYTESVRFTNDVNFVGDKSNRPGFIRRSGNAHGPIMFATSLMSFVLNDISLKLSYWDQVKHGSIDWKTYKRNPDKFRLDNPGAYGLLFSVVALSAFAGALGLPFAQDADELVEEVTGLRLSEMMRHGIIDLGKQFDMSEENGDVLADAIMTGLPGAMGIGLGQSVGLGRIASYQTGKPFTFMNLLGAGGSIIERGSKAVRAVASDPTDVENWKRGYRRAAPAGLQYWHELVQVVKHNAQTDTEGKIVSNPLDTGGAVSRVLGFTPASVTQERKSNYRVKRLEERRNEKRVRAAGQIGRLMHEAERTGDDEKMKKAITLLSKFVSDNHLTVRQRESFLASITRDRASRKEQTIDIPNRQSAEILAAVQQSNPNFVPTVKTPMEKRRDQFDTARMLRDPIAQKLSRPSKSMILQNILYQRLVQNGVNPTVARMIATKKRDELSAMRGVDLPQLGSR